MLVLIVGYLGNYYAMLSKWEIWNVAQMPCLCTPNALSTSVRFSEEIGDIDQNMFWISKIHITVDSLAISEMTQKFVFVSFTCVQWFPKLLRFLLKHICTKKLKILIRLLILSQFPFQMKPIQLTIAGDKKPEPCSQQDQG